MKYWILALRPDRMAFCMKRGKFGLKRRYILHKVNVGDPVVCYATKEARIVGLGQITEEHHTDTTPVFSDRSIFDTEEVFAERIGFEAKPLEHPIDFMDVIDQMEFVTEPAYWQLYFRSGILEISRKDFETIKKAATQKAGV